MLEKSKNGDVPKKSNLDIFNNHNKKKIREIQRFRQIVNIADFSDIPSATIGTNSELNISHNSTLGDRQKFMAIIIDRENWRLSFRDEKNTNDYDP